MALSLTEFRRRLAEDKKAGMHDLPLRSAADDYFEEVGAEIDEHGFGVPHRGTFGAY